MPADNSFGYATSKAESPISPSSWSLTARRAEGSRPLASRPNSRFSRTVIHGKIASSWRTYPLCQPGPSMVAPPQRTDPLVGRRKPAKMRRRVVLPQPTGPSTAANSLSSTLRLRPSKAWVGVTRFEPATFALAMRKGRVHEPSRRSTQNLRPQFHSGPYHAPIPESPMPHRRSTSLWVQLRSKKICSP